MHHLIPSPRARHSNEKSDSARDPSAPGRNSELCAGQRQRGPDAMPRLGGCRQLCWARRSTCKRQGLQGPEDRTSEDARPFSGKSRGNPVCICSGTPDSNSNAQSLFCGLFFFFSDPTNSDRGDGEKSVQPVAYSRSVTTLQKPTVAPNSPIATVTFITIQNGNVVHLMPDWAIKWVRKNEKKYPDVRFQTSDKPVAGARNFVVAFSASSAELQGFQPVTYTDTSTNTSPVSGNGTVTDNQGEMWNYTYNGTVTTTTTTTTHEQVPYTRTSNTLYVTAFNEQGETVAQRWHVYSTQSGGDSANALGYNLGNALGAINARGHMLKTIVDDLVEKGK